VDEDAREAKMSHRVKTWKKFIEGRRVMKEKERMLG